MPRMNRRKWHRRQRNRAEERDRERVLARRAARAERVEKEQAIARAMHRQHRRADVVRSHSAPDLTAWYELMELAHEPEQTQALVSRVVASLCKHVPTLSTLGNLPLQLLLARQPWVRDPADFLPPRGSVARRRNAFALHLLAMYPVPTFLLNALDVPEAWVARVPVEDEWAVQVLAHIGRGKSLRTLVGTPVLPTPLTRRMCHLFLSAKAQTSPILALRSAQVRGFGGGQALADALMRTRLSTLRGADPHVGEAFWHRVIRWLVVGTEGRVPPDLEDLLAHVERLRREGLRHDRVVEPWKRPFDAVLTDARFHSRGRRDNRALPASGLLTGAAETEHWTVEELDSTHALEDEGITMSNCVRAYRQLVHKRRVALFSFRRKSERKLTVEVALGKGAVVQVKGPANREPSEEERTVVARWALGNHLMMAV